jgi:hypothetical protein
VVNRIVVPWRRRSRTISQISLRLRGSRPVSRLVEEEHARLGEQAGRQVEPPSHAARVRLRGSVGGVGELETFEQLRRSAAGLRAREPEQAPEHLQVLAARQELVDRGELTG